MRRCGPEPALSGPGSLSARFRLARAGGRFLDRQESRRPIGDELEERIELARSKDLGDRRVDVAKHDPARHSAAPAAAGPRNFPGRRTRQSPHRSGRPPPRDVRDPSNGPHNGSAGPGPARVQPEAVPEFRDQDAIHIVCLERGLQHQSPARRVFEEFGQLTNASAAAGQAASNAIATATRPDRGSPGGREHAGQAVCAMAEDEPLGMVAETERGQASRSIGNRTRRDDRTSGTILSIGLTRAVTKSTASNSRDDSEADS